MAPALAWRNLIPGVIAVVVLIAITVVLLANGGVGRVPGDKIDLYVVTNSARGVMKGTQVWVSGQQVGTVESIGFRRATTDSNRVVISVRVQERAARQIRHDSDVRVQSGTNVIGPMVVYVSPGTPGSAAVRDGDTVFANTQADFATAAAQLGDAAKQLGPIMADAKVIMASARDSRGTVGALLQSSNASRVTQLRAQVGRLRAQLLPAGGNPRRAALMAAVSDVMAQVDSVRALLGSERTTLGRFRRDSTLGRTVASVRDELAALRGRIDSADGSLWRFQNDSSVTRALADAQREMGLLFEDIRKRPVRYIAF